MVIKAIETQYKGYRFRSRLEARWAIYFDVFNINWTYEREGFQLDYYCADGCCHTQEWYLPDFYLPEIDLFIEIKPFKPQQSEMSKVMGMAMHKRVLVILGDDMLYCGWSLWTPAQSPNTFLVTDWLTQCACQFCGGLTLFIPNTRQMICLTGRCPGSRLVTKLKHNIEAQLHPLVDKAAETARSARFEHGEKPLQNLSQTRTRKRDRR